ncbi:uncharacterized protein LOC127081779 [Lathyrus oleraceus]|uniref:uncharacterized protein LOC127081779 n=1 Tax=Pisum sativum TaxID=3888 RepID=UPI0021D064FF|nr:uncharacterized protein LOC127081779 [Pisum sativum]
MFAKFKEILATLRESISFHEILELIPKFAKFMKALLNRTKEKRIKEHVNMTKNNDMVKPQSLQPKLKDSGKFMKELLNWTKEKRIKEHVNMTKNDDIVKPQSLQPKLKELGRFTISYNISGFNILHALCDLGSSINVMPLKTVKELKVGEITPSNMTLSLVELSITHSIGSLRDILVPVDDLLFPIDFVVHDTKGDSGGFIILGHPFLATGKAKIDVETGQLILKSNKRNVVFKVYDWTSYVDNLDTFYYLEEKGRKVYKGTMRKEVTGVRVSFAPDVP